MPQRVPPELPLPVARMARAARFPPTPRAARISIRGLAGLHGAAARRLAKPASGGGVLELSNAVAYRDKPPLQG